MTIRIRIAGLEAEADVDRRWAITHAEGNNPGHERAIVRLLNSAYGPEWEPDFGVYEPNVNNAAARQVAINLGAEVLELEPIVDGPDERVY